MSEPRDLKAFNDKMKEINSTKETDPRILRQIERNQAAEIQTRLMEELDRLRGEVAKRQWQPIETVLKDGTEILIGCRVKELSGHSFSQFVVFYDERPDRPTHPWQTPDGIAYHRDLPTHWMPLPEPPKEAK